MGELLNCPFCGGEAKLMLLGNFYRIGCWDCLAVGVDKHEKNDAIAAWNRRQPQQQVAPEATLTEQECDTRVKWYGELVAFTLLQIAEGKEWERPFEDKWLEEAAQAIDRLRLQHPVAPTPAQQVASDIALAVLQRTLDDGEDIHVPSLGVTIEPPAPDKTDA